MRSLPFTDLLSNIVDNRGRTCPVAESGIPLIATNCVKNTGLFPTFEKVRYVDESTYKTWFRGHPKPGDLVFVTKGSPGQVCLVPDPVPFCIAQDMVAIRANSEVVHPNYLFAALRSPEVQQAISNMHVGSLIPHFKKGDFSKLSIPVPEMSIQRVVGDTFIELSSKIELNRKMNATLEAMARALFRDWFVDFGPTRARMEGREPWLSPDLWSLFPERLDKDGKPEGWEEKPLDEIADFLNGIALQKFPAEDETDCLPVIKIAELRNGITGKSNRASRKVPAQYVIRDGDFLFSWSGSLLAKFWTGGEGALNQHLFKVTSNSYPAWFFSEWVQHHLEEFQIIAASKATTMGHIQRGHLKAAKTICPPDHVIKRMGDMMAPLTDRIIQNELESRTLARTRDLLLPRLMSGELRLAEAERLASEVA
ncbi:MAG: restriction endonuclease [Erythrobacter sp.]|nr:restriction endonuclease [Erythrobacter sp.]